MIEMESTHQDVLTLHPLLALLEEPEGNGDDPLMILAELLAKIEARLAAIEEALSISPSEPVEL
jgi:hypothetical protein